MLLRDYFKTSPIGLIRHKTLAIIMRSQDMLIREIAAALFVGEPTIERWLQDFLEKRMASIFSGRIGNEYASKLTRLQKGEIKKATAEFIKLYPNKKICIIWDNATCHKGILIRQALSRREVLQRVHLVNLPPYAPDHNPIEYVWNTTKEKLSNKQPIFPLPNMTFSFAVAIL